MATCTVIGSRCCVPARRTGQAVSSFWVTATWQCLCASKSGQFSTQGSGYGGFRATMIRTRRSGTIDSGGTFLTVIYMLAGAGWAIDLIFADLGGVFKECVRCPRFEASRPMFATRRHYLRQLPHNGRWRGGLPLRVRDAIFPDDVEALRGLRADVLVTHEAPSSHRHGFDGIDIAAEACRARLVVHGHHHEDSARTIPSGGVQVRGLGRAEVLRQRRGELAWCAATLMS